ncbi:MAG: hypothetical protein ACXITR_09385 [Cyanobacterium sp.]
MLKIKNRIIPLGLIATTGVLASGFMNAAQAFVQYNLSGTFTDGNTLSGFFNFNGNNVGTYNISRLDGGNSVTTYNNITDTFTSGNGTNFTFQQGTSPTTTLSFSFSPTLITGQSADIGNTFALSGFEGLGLGTNFTGTATAVPFEAESLPVLGASVLFGLGLWGKNKLKK